MATRDETQDALHVERRDLERRHLDQYLPPDEHAAVRARLQEVIRLISHEWRGAPVAEPTPTTAVRKKVRKS